MTVSVLLSATFTPLRQPPAQCCVGSSCVVTIKLRTHTYTHTHSEKNTGKKSYWISVQSDSEELEDLFFRKGGHDIRNDRIFLADIREQVIAIWGLEAQGERTLPSDLSAYESIFHGLARQ